MTPEQVYLLTDIGILIVLSINCFYLLKCNSKLNFLSEGLKRKIIAEINTPEKEIQNDHTNKRN